MESREGVVVRVGLRELVGGGVDVGVVEELRGEGVGGSSGGGGDWCAGGKGVVRVRWVWERGWIRS